jgi:murein DD-endopeptidase MepM/ murein hydrolase activator NlpD
MRSHRRFLVAVLTLSLLTTTPGVGARELAAPDDALAAVTDRLRLEITVTARLHRWPVSSTRAAILEARLASLETALDEARAGADAVLLPIIDRVDEGAVSTAIMKQILEAGPDRQDSLRRLLGVWVLHRDAVTEARRLRVAVGKRLGLDLDFHGRVCPVEGRHRYEHDWGDGRPWGRTHKGIDLMAEWGAPLVSIERGIITQADWHWAGGWGIYVHGTITGQDYYYAHLAGYAPGVGPGQVVDAGDVLGWVGMTGNATTPHLHLGWMPHGGGLDRLVDPYRLVADLCG